MANISITNLEIELRKLSDVLSHAEWNDEVKKSYGVFIDEEKMCTSNLSWHLDSVEKANNHVESVDVEQLARNFDKCNNTFIQLQGGL